MSKLLPIIGGITGTAIIGGTGAYLISTQKYSTFKEQFKHSLISSDAKGEAIFKEKLKKLKDSGDTNPHNDKLKEAKSQAKATSSSDTAGLDKFKEACQEIYENSFTDKKSEIFKDFQTYCSKNIKDEITTAKWGPSISSFDWSPNLEKLKKTNKKLINNLETIAKKTGAANKDLTEWCQGIENTLFEDPEDITFKNANEFCTKP